MTKTELMAEIIAKQDELIKLLNDGYGTEMVEAYQYLEVQNCESELASLKQQLAELSSPISRPDFFESKLKEDKPLSSTNNNIGICGDDGEYFRDKDGSLSLR